MSFWESQRVIVTGGAGFLGSRVVARLAGRNCGEVIVPRSRRYDLRREEDVVRLCEESRADMVIHLAATVGGIGANQASPGSFFYDNLMMGVQLMEQARRFAEAIRAEYPDKMLSYNCSPSFNWAAHLDVPTMERFHRELGAMGYKYQFVTLAGFHVLNHGMFKLAGAYRDRGMAGYAELQGAEFAAEAEGYTATRHQHEVGTGYFDAVAEAIGGGRSSTTALADSTEAAQFETPAIAAE